MTNTNFEPIPRIWAFHLIYLCVTIALGCSLFPYHPFASMFLLAAICVVGLVVARLKWFMAAHILATAIGLMAPIVVFARLLPNTTLILFSGLVLGITAARKILF